jgi:glyoxylase-like metal-dependent hydrolase (beta-lactamase superfamily II)/rhodanese-related sulfurtransferase
MDDVPVIHSLVDEGLGNSSYLVDLGDGRALIIDPSRDPRPYVEIAANDGLRVAFVAETHLHADFVSGSRELAAEGAVVLGASAGRREFPHRGLSDGDEVDLGGLVLRAIATPGHTPEHLAYLLLDGARPAALFTGGSLLVGAVARTDLVDPTRTEELARAAYRSIRERILSLPDSLPVYPTHGAGSFCSAPTGAERTTTVGRERAANAMLAMPDEDAFVAKLLGSLGSYPAYFRRLGEVNRRGPKVLGQPPSLAQLGPADVRRLVADGATLVDGRPVAAFASGHVRGALSIALRPEFATWLGWLVAPEYPIVFVLGDGQDRGDLVRQALKVGYEDLAGELAGGMAAWQRAGYGEQRVELLSPGRVDSRPLIDVRQDVEFVAGHVPGALHVELGALATAADLPPGRLTLMCGHGERAMSGASVLERAGRLDLAVVRGGPQDWGALPGHGLAVAE